MLKKSDLEQFKNLLLSLRAEIKGDVEQLRVHALEGVGASADSKSPTHIAELGTDAYEQDFSLRRVENDQETLIEIDDALQRIEDGTYGQCEMCTDEGRTQAQSRISKTRLKAIPFARHCIGCERKREELFR